MATPLPNQPDLIVPIDWQGETAKATMQAGSYYLSGTIGFNPFREIATLSWMLPAATAKALIQTLKAGKMNAVYDYTCNVMGAVKIRAIGTYGYREVATSNGQLIQVTAGFERL